MGVITSFFEVEDAQFPVPIEHILGVQKETANRAFTRPENLRLMSITPCHMPLEFNCNAPLF